MLHATDHPKAVEFFENKIRPVLVEQCYQCHSAEAEKKGKLRGGLRLDTKAALLKGGDNGKAVVAGKPTEGTLLKSLHYDGEIQMPPKGKLPESVLKDFEQWIKDGATDPRDENTAPVATGIDLEKGRQFWAFQPLKPTPPPEIKSSSIPVKSPIDAFIQSKWREQGVTPAGLADKRTLLRRASLDLLGLPPTPEQVEAFEKDTSPQAWANAIERLLASPHYGERWARHWLDVARYAEDQAHTFAVTPKTNAYQYRDWVIRQFNDDRPYDEFIRLQIAGDMLPESVGDPFTRLAGLGFMGLGAEYYKNTAREQAIAEELDDRIDTLTRGILGLTVACARCHDHKFDPIPTRDYYSLAGIYNGVNLTTAPLATADVVKQYNTAQEQVKAAENLVNKLLGEAGQTAAKLAVQKTSQYLQAARELTLKKGKADQLATKQGLEPYFLNRWVKFLYQGDASKVPSLFKNWLTLKAEATSAELSTEAEAIQSKLMALSVPEAVPAKGAKANANKSIDPLMKAMFLDPTAPLFVSIQEAEKLVTSSTKPKLESLRNEVDKLKKAVPPAPPVAHVVSGTGQAMKVYIRGNPATKGEDAPKGFVRVLSHEAKPNFSRLDLANAMTSPNNPLTARVIVNRVWAWHFGRGIVGTPSNFGQLGERPTHPELLDHLASEFIKHNWSIKWLHREIMKSRVYQLAATVNESTKKDAANVYLWRGTRHRLDVESWRDSLLFVSGQLDPTPGGPTYNLKESGARRRTVYAKVSRHELDGLLRLFDFPDANVTADKRNTTTVPQQQLFALNSEFMVNQAKGLASRVEKLGNTDADRIQAAYQLAFQRAASPAEVKIAEQFLKLPTSKDDKLTRWQQYAQALLASNEFLYVE